MAKNTYNFTDVKCSKRDSHNPKLDEYIFSFTYKGNNIEYYMFTSKMKHVSEDMAKKEFNRLIKNGKIEKYAKRFDKDEKRKKRILIPLFSILVAGAIAGAAYGIYYVITHKDDKSTVERVENFEYLINEDITLSNPAVRIGE